MKVTNKQKNALPTNMYLHELGKAVSALDLTNIPPENRGAALMEHLGRIASTTVTDPRKRAELQSARLLRAQLEANGKA